MSRVNVKKLFGTSRVVLPTYNTTQRDALTDVELATVIFNPDSGTLEFWDGAAWTVFK